MERKRIGLIFVALCLALAFSVSPVAAQCGKCEKCDRDGDTLIKDTKPCRDLCGGHPDLNDSDANFCEGDGGGGKKIPVTVTFRDAPLGPLEAPDPPDRLMSDCKTGDCPYIAKEQEVGAFIGTTGNFDMRLLTKKGDPHGEATRRLFLDFTKCPVTASEPVESCTPPFKQDFSFGVVRVFTRGIDLREMAVGAVGAKNNLRLGVAVNLDSLGNGDWRVFFDPSNLNCQGSSPDSPDVSHVRITRTLVDTWEIEAGQTAVACLGKLAGGGELIFSGLYEMPFKMTVQKK